MCALERATPRGREGIAYLRNSLHKALSQLVKISLNRHYQPERTFTMVRVFVSAVTTDTVNESAKGYALLVEMLCYLSIAVIKVVELY